MSLYFTVEYGIAYFYFAPLVGKNIPLMIPQCALRNGETDNLI